MTVAERPSSSLLQRDRPPGTMVTGAIGPKLELLAQASMDCMAPPEAPGPGYQRSWPQPGAPGPGFHDSYGAA